MERVFSVDDILGTFWKLDTQGESGGSGHGGVGSHADLQRLHREHSVSSSGLAQMGRSGSFHRMNRSASEWAFQEFLKEHVAASGALAGSGGSGSSNPGEGTSVGGSDPFQDEAPTGDDKASQQVTPDGNRPNDREPQLAPSGTESPDGLPGKMLQSIEGEQGPGASTASPPDSHLMPPPQATSSSGPHGGSRYQPGGLSRLPSREAGGQPSFGQVSASQGPPPGSAETHVRSAMAPTGSTGVQPLFQGLHEDAAATNPQEYEKMLKQRLAVACAMASTRVRSVSNSPAVPLSRPQAAGPPVTALPPGPLPMPALPPPPLRGGPPLAEGPVPRTCLVPAPAPIGIPALPPKPGHARYGQVGGVPATSSSREPSDDEDARSEGEDELVASLEHVTDPDEIKRIKRMLSNRESARRSRRRKQAHLSDLETQVAQLQGENSNLAGRLSDIGRKYNEAAVDNRVLKSDVEALRAKVKMAEEMVTRAHHMAHYMYAPPYRPPDPGAHMPSTEMPYYPRALRPGHVSPPQGSEMGGPLHPGGHPGAHAYATPAPHHPHDMGPHPGPLPPGPPMLPAHGAAPADMAGVGTKMERTPSMQRVASLEHLQKRIRGPMRGPWGSPWEERSGASGESMAESHHPHAQHQQQAAGES